MQLPEVSVSFFTIVIIGTVIVLISIIMIRIIIHLIYYCLSIQYSIHAYFVCVRIRRLLARFVFRI